MWSSVEVRQQQMMYNGKHRRPREHRQQQLTDHHHQHQKINLDRDHYNVTVKLETASPPELVYVGEDMANIEAVQQNVDDHFMLSVPQVPQQQQLRHHQRHQIGNRHSNHDARRHHLYQQQQQLHQQQQQQQAPIYTDEYLIHRRSSSSTPFRRQGAARSFSSEAVVIRRNIVVDYDKGGGWNDVQFNERDQRMRHVQRGGGGGGGVDEMTPRGGALGGPGFSAVDRHHASRERHLYDGSVGVGDEYELSRRHFRQEQHQHRRSHLAQSEGSSTISGGGVPYDRQRGQFQELTVDTASYENSRERRLLPSAMVEQMSEDKSINDDASCVSWDSRAGSRQLPCTVTSAFGSDSMDQSAEQSTSAEGLDDDTTSNSAAGASLAPLSKPRVEEELCLICGDRASGYHYNALSCEGCKGFFRRSITRSANYVCKYGGNCEMDMWMRRKCQACRLKQCRVVGMKEECLLSERQCIARNARRQTRSKLMKPNGPRHRQGTTSGLALKKAAAAAAALTASMGPLTPCSVYDDRQSPGCGRSPLERLSDDHRELVSRIVGYQDKYELPSPEDIARVKEMEIASSIAKASPSDAVFGHMVEMTILVTRLVVEFAKRLPGFQSLSKNDQIALLKGSASEVMMLRTARRYDPETNTVVFGDGQPFTRNCMAFGGLQGFVDLMFDFSKGMATIGVDNAEYALLTALCIFSDRPGVTDQKAVQNIQEVYSEVLLAYVTQRRIAASHFLAKLLMKLVELRTLSFDHSNCLYRLTIEKGSLPPLLSEYFDIPDGKQIREKMAGNGGGDAQTSGPAKADGEVPQQQRPQKLPPQTGVKPDPSEREDDVIAIEVADN